jgi:hypothetical protein
VSSYGGIQGTATDQLARRGIQDPASVTRAGLAPSQCAADQHTLGAEAGYGRVESIDRQNLRAGTELRHKANQ